MWPVTITLVRADGCIDSADLEGLLEEKQRASKDADAMIQGRDGSWALR